MTITRCAVCNTKDYELVYKSNLNLNVVNEELFSARRLPDRIHYQIVRCQKCGLIYSNPILEEKKLERLYRKSKYNYGNYEIDLRTTYAKYLRKYIKYVPKKNRLLEIGCGNGFFLEKALNLGFERVYGVEPSQDSVNKAKDRVKNQILVDIFRPGQFKKNYFDIICFFQVIDHLTDPNKFLAEGFKILKPGGGILCINHDVNSLSAKILREKSPIFDIEHTYLYDKKTLTMIFEKHHFKIVDVFPIANLYPVSYWLRMFPFPEVIKKTLLQIADFIGISSKRISLNAGNIGIFVRKPG